jgi:predicted DNA-binding transcriptional regulator AlpA
MTDDPTNELLTTPEVAMITRTPASTLRNWRNTGAGPRSFRLGKRVVYRHSDVQAWIATCEAREHRSATWSG